MRYPETRQARRIAARAAAREKAEQRQAERLARLAAREPRANDRRQAERRRDGAPADLEARMRAAGISDDRRVGQRRTGRDRRR